MSSGPFTSLSPPADRLPSRIAGHIHSRTSTLNDKTLPVVELDSDTSQLLPRRERPRRVRIQGRLVMVRSVSVANIGQAKSGTPTARTDMSRENSEIEDEDRDDDEDDDVVEGDMQFRGYGIGGAGNIRRPTDVMGASSSASASLLSLVHTSHSPITSQNTTKSGKLRLRMTELIHSIKGYASNKGSA
ncbi:hypothetical protein F5Y09DRAFT_200546 [Xylaria sp. FL1042]|nr:hypothetical protein F5Y09DRAFT_200546 [Xylaria sp. FL1042]